MMLIIIDFFVLFQIGLQMEETSCSEMTLCSLP